MTFNPKTIGLALVATVNPLLALLVALSVLHWTDAQIALVYGAANTGIALIVALLAHFRVGTKTETVAVAGGVTAFTTALLMTLVGFDVVRMTAETISLVVTFEVSLIALAGAILAREAVTADTTP